MATNNSFSCDPYLRGIDPRALRDGVYEEGDVSRAFGLPLVAAWRSFPPSMESAYQKIVNRVAPCFDSTTGHETGGRCKDAEPEAHIYPFQDLHVTIATFRSLLANPPCPSNADDAERIKAFCVKVAERSTKRDGWPIGGSNSPKILRLRPKEMRLGKTNAYILWEETTGNLEAMRHCLAREMESHQPSDLDPALSWSVPNIVHSTFMRFWGCPSNPQLIRELFDGNDLVDMLPAEVVVETNIKLACETVPCMHIAYDEFHVLWKEDSERYA